jgi:hypothetical protein
MGLITGILSATVKTALTPVALVKDVVNIATGEDANATKQLLKSAVDDTKEAVDDFADGKLL